MPNLHSWTDYIIRKGVFLSALFLLSALILSVWVDAHPASNLILRHYIDGSVHSSVIVLAATLSGALFLEDILRRSK